FIAGAVCRHIYGICFFFQAEDGIRGFHVTGVQTCALPILANTAFSVNIKERLDFSCALFDTEGNLIANAPHMPVHLGSMGESIKTVIRENAGKMQPGDVFVLNDPYHGGTHLPDITVITPVYIADEATPTFYVGSRGHHADVGGTTPGSMPPFST